MLRDLAARRLAEFRPELGRALVGEAIDALLGRVEPAAVARKPTPAEREALIESLAKTYGDRLAVQVLPDDVNAVGQRRRASGSSTWECSAIAPTCSRRRRPSWNGPPTSPATCSASPSRPCSPGSPSTSTPTTSAGSRNGSSRSTGSCSTAPSAPPTGRPSKNCRSWAATGSRPPATRLRRSCSPSAPTLDKPFADRLLLWKKTKTDLVEEMSTALQMPGWGNSFTQPIANRIEMLSTGVRLPVAVKVFGSKLDDIQRVSQEIAGVLRGVRGAADVFPDQIVGKGYVEIKIDRKKAARYGINVGDIQDVVEVAMGGRPLTMTVEGRERYPVRVRYARDYRDDVEALKNILVSARGMAADAGQAGGMGGDGRGDACSAGGRSQAQPVQIPLAALADIRVVEGPSMIKSENGLLRSYIQLRVRDRDEVGFVEEAQRVVAEKVKLPAGMYLEWTGTFEHQVRAKKTLRIVFPAVIAVIVLDPLPDAQELDRRAADDDQRARRPGGRGDLPVAVRLQLQRGGAGRLHRLLRHGGGDGRGDARLPPRGDRRARGPGADRLDRRAAAGDPRRGDPPAAAQAADRRRGDHLDRPDALGHRRRGRGDPADGGAGAGRPADRRRGDRRVPARALLRRPEAAMAEAPWNQALQRYTDDRAETRRRVSLMSNVLDRKLRLEQEFFRVYTHIQVSAAAKGPLLNEREPGCQPSWKQRSGREHVPRGGSHAAGQPLARGAGDVAR